MAKGIGWIAMFVGYCALGPSLRAQEVNPEPGWQPTTVLATAKLSEQAYMVMVPGTIGDREYRFVLATGESYSYLDRSLLKGARQLTYREIGYTQDDLDDAGSEAKTKDLSKWYSPPSLYFGKSRADLKFVAPIDLDTGRLRDLSFPFHGILAMDILHNLVLHIDPERDIVLLCEPDAANPPPGKSTSLFLDSSGLPHAKAEFASQLSEPFQIDTGLLTGSGEFNATVQMQLGLVDNATLVNQESEADDNGDPVLHEFYKITSLAMAGAPAKNLTMLRGTRNRVGTNYLLRQRITLDFKNEKMYVESTRFSAACDRESQFGLVLKPIEQGWQISSVQPPAERVGLKAGDIITKIGNYTYKENPLQARRCLTAPLDQPLKLEVLREEKELTITLPISPPVAEQQ